jgi:hypothetical protein
MFPGLPSPATLLNRVKAIVRRVAGVVGDRRRTVSPHASAVPALAISPVLRGIAQGWMRTKLRALSALMRRIEAGERLDTPVGVSGAAQGAFAPAVRVAVPPEERLPRRFGWMCAFEPTIRQDGAAFAEWLSEPAMRAMISAAPERMARVISPILTAAGTDRPAWFPVMPRRRIDVVASCRGKPGPALDGSGSLEPAGTPTTDDGHRSGSICCGDALVLTAGRRESPTPLPPTEREMSLRVGSSSGLDERLRQFPDNRISSFAFVEKALSKMRRLGNPFWLGRFVTIS